MSRALVHTTRGYLGWRHGTLAHAATELRQGLSLHDRAGQPFGRPFTLWCLGHVTLATGDTTEAHRLLVESLRAGALAGEGDAIACALEGLAAVCVEDARPDAAARLLGIAHARRTQLEIPAPLLTHDQVVATEHRLAAQLSSTTLAAAHAAGARTTLDGVDDVEDVLAAAGLAG